MIFQRVNPFSKKFHQWSILSQLAWVYILSSFGILALTILLLYWIFTTRLENENDQFLRNKLAILQRLSNTYLPTDPALHEEIVIEPPLYHYFSRIVGENNQMLIETPGMNEKIPMAAFNKNNKITNTVQIKQWKAPKKIEGHEKHYLLLSAGISADEPKKFIQIAMDISSQRKMIEGYQRDMMLVLIMSIMGSASIVIFLTGRGLRPLAEMTKSIRYISIAQLKERLNPADWPTELSNLAGDFNNMMNRIEEGVIRLSQFSADLAHELRTPINNLIGEAEVILSRPRSSAEYQKTIESSLEEFSRLSRLINNLLFLARAENPQMAITYSWIEIDPLIENIRDFYLAIAEEKSITMSCQKSCLQVKADRQLLGQALSNLVANALQYTPQGGIITLVAHRLSNQKIQILVGNTGQGIPPEHLPHLFDRFYRVDSARSWQTGGTGLGLAIVKSIMDLHKGRVDITSQTNEGVMVTLTLSEGA